MTLNQVGGVLRAAVPALVAYAVGAGWIPADSASEVGAAIITAIAAIWSLYSNSRNAQIANVAAMPEVKRVVTASAVANIDFGNNPKVTVD